MKKIILTMSMLAMLVLPFVSTQEVYACSCVMPGTVQEEMERASAVFLGTVRSIEQKRFGERSKEVVLSVEKAWKGVTNSEVEIITAQDSAACGFHFEEGKQYVVYTNSEDPYAVSLCSRTAAFGQAKDDIKQLGDGYIPVESEDSDTFSIRIVKMEVFMFGVVGIILILIGVQLRKK